VNRNLTPNEYHARREQERQAQREQTRIKRLTAVHRAIRQIAPRFPAIEAVYLFGSVVQPGRHGQLSDIDVAVQTDDVAAESAFWQALEEALEWSVDVRPYQDRIREAVERSGELVYARKDDHS
jgi:predicted nucleotidyltransferase